RSLREAGAGGHRDGGRTDYDHPSLPADADRDRHREGLHDDLPAADTTPQHAPDEAIVNPDVTEMTHHDAQLNDEGFHEIQLSRKQLAVLFMATATVPGVTRT